MTGSGRRAGIDLGWGTVLATTFGVIVTFVPGGTDPYFGPKVGVLFVGVSVALACHVAALAARRDRPVLPRVAVAVGAYGVAMALATVVSVSPLTALIGRGARHAGLLELGAMLVLAWLVVVHTWRRPERLVQLVVAIVAASGVHAVYVVLVRVGIDVPWPGQRPYTIPVGTMGNSNFAGAQLVISVPFLLLLARRAVGQRARRALIALIVVVLLALLFTDARGAVIALFPAVAVTGLVAPTLVPRWSVRAAVVLSVVALVPLVAAASGFSWGSGSPGSKLLNNETLTSRIQYWKGTVGIVADHPLLGTGPDTFGLVFPRYSPREMTGRPVPVDKPHNILLERATDAGLLGLAAYLAVLGLTTAAVVGARRRLTGVPLALLGAWSGALVAYLVQGMTSIDAIPLALDGWLAIAALAALADPWVERARGRDRVDDVVARPLNGLLVLLWPTTALVVLVAVGMPWIADLSLGDGVNRSAAVARGESEYSMTESFEFAIATNPVDPSVRITAAATVADLLRSPAVSDGEKAFLAAFAARESDRALEDVPDDVAARRASALAHGVLARSEGGESWRATEQRWRELEGLDPFDSTIRLDHAQFLLDWNEATPDDLAAARRAAARALVDDANALTDDSSWFTWYRVAQAYERLGARDEAIAAARHSLTIERARPGPRDLIQRLGAKP
jgi:O-antigen ligase